MDLYHKTFFSRNEFNSIVSYRLACSQSVLLAWTHASLLRYRIYYDRKKFCDTGPSFQRFPVFVG